MPKHDEDSGGIGKKNIEGYLGSVCVHLMQQQKKAQVFTKNTYLLSASTLVSGLQKNSK
jgi:hypothetical protein